MRVKSLHRISDALCVTTDKMEQKSGSSKHVWPVRVELLARKAFSRPIFLENQ